MTRTGQESQSSPRKLYSAKSSTDIAIATHLRMQKVKTLYESMHTAYVYWHQTTAAVSSISEFRVIFSVIQDDSGKLP